MYHNTHAIHRSCNLTPVLNPSTPTPHQLRKNFSFFQSAENWKDYYHICQPNGYRVLKFQHKADRRPRCLSYLVYTKQILFAAGGKLSFTGSPAGAGYSFTCLIWLIPRKKFPGSTGGHALYRFALNRLGFFFKYSSYSALTHNTSAAVLIPQFFSYGGVDGTMCAFTVQKIWDLAWHLTSQFTGERIESLPIYPLHFIPVTLSFSPWSRRKTSEAPALSLGFNFVLRNGSFPGRFPNFLFDCVWKALLLCMCIHQPTR